MKRLCFRAQYLMHYRRAKAALGHMTRILDYFSETTHTIPEVWSHAVQVCPSIDRHRRHARREVRLARFFRRKLQLS